jgi:hypothetical protein
MPNGTKKARHHPFFLTNTTESDIPTSPALIAEVNKRILTENELLACISINP